MAEYDLTKTIIPYLDRHLAFPLLNHLSETEIFPVEQIQAAQYELAKSTNMVDYTISLYEQLNGDKPIPKGMPHIHRLLLMSELSLEFLSKRENAVSTHERLQQEAQVVLDVIENPEVAQALRQDKLQNLQYLKDHYNVRAP